MCAPTHHDTSVPLIKSQCCSLEPSVSQDGCQEPCEEDQVCIPTRVRCLDADRCPRRKCGTLKAASMHACACTVVAYKLHYYRRFIMHIFPALTTVDIQQLSCEGSSGAMVCGSDGQNYSSACDLYRERFGRVRLRHQGDCASADCPNEMVGGLNECTQTPSSVPWMLHHGHNNHYNSCIVYYIRT